MTPLLIHYCGNQNSPWIYRWHSETEHVLLPSPFFWEEFSLSLAGRIFIPGSFNLLFSPSKSIWSYPSLPWAAYPTASARPFCPPRSPGSSNALLHHLRWNMLKISTREPSTMGSPFSQKLPILQRDFLWEWYGKVYGNRGVPLLWRVSRISLKNTCYIQAIRPALSFQQDTGRTTKYAQWRSKSSSHISRFWLLMAMW